MSYEIIIDEFGIGHAIVVTRHDEIVDFFIDPASDKLTFFPPKTFMSAIVQRRVRRMGGYFIKVPNGKDGFLITKNTYAEGAAVSVMSQVFYEEGKPQRYTDRLKMVSKFFIIDEGGTGITLSKKITEKPDLEKLNEILLNKNVTVILRSSTSELCPYKLIEKFGKAVSEYDLMKKAINENKIFYFGLAKKTLFDRFDKDHYKIIEKKGIFETMGIWDKLMIEVSGKKVPFGKGSYVFLEQTKSFCFIDVNSGSNFSASINEINISACEKIHKLIKQRGIGGKILIDFLPSSKGLRKRILNIFQGYSTSDSQKNIVWGWTRGGAFEIERERDKTPLNLLLDG